MAFWDNWKSILDFKLISSCFEGKQKERKNEYKIKEQDWLHSEQNLIQKNKVSNIFKIQITDFGITNLVMSISSIVG